MNITDFQPSKRFVGLEKGKPKSGKSIFAASFPNILMIDLDKRFDTVAQFYQKVLKKTDIEVFQPDSFKALDQKMRDLKKECPYTTVHIASLTRLARVLMTEICAQRGDTKGKKVGGISVTIVEDYSGETAGIVKIIEALLSLPCHILLEAHLIATANKDEICLLTGGKKIAGEVPAYFNEVYFFEAEAPITSDGKPTHRFYTKQYGIHECSTALDLPYSVDFTDRSAFDILCDYNPHLRETTKENLMEELMSKIQEKGGNNVLTI